MVTRTHGGDPLWPRNPDVGPFLHCALASAVASASAPAYSPSGIVAAVTPLPAFVPGCPHTSSVGNL
jgi:hypothetical protein